MDDQNNTNMPTPAATGDMTQSQPGQDMPAAADNPMPTPPPVMPEPVAPAMPEPQPMAGGPMDQTAPISGDADGKVMAELKKIEDELQKMEQKSEE